LYTLPRHAVALASESSERGSGGALRDDDDENIYPGSGSKRKPDGEKVEIPARRITRMTTRRVITDLAPSDAIALPAYHED